MSSRKVSLTKLEVCRRQLEGAIRMYFEGGDDVVVLALAFNAHEIADKLAGEVKRSIDIRRLMLEAIVPPTAPKKMRAEIEKKVHDLLFKARNFVKHARRGDPGERLDFDSSLTELWLLDACSAFEHFGGTRPLIGVFRMWAKLTFARELYDTPPALLEALVPQQSKLEFYQHWLPIAVEADSLETGGLQG